MDQQKNHLLLRELLVLKIVQGQKNLVNYFDGYLSVNTLHVVCEYCEMGSLSDLYEKRKCHLSEPEIALTCKSVLTALQYLHQHGVLHRDIKAANIFLTSLGEIKLGDFGTCAGITPAQRYRRTFVGTPFWMPPEIMLNSNSRLSDYDTSVDIWSLGITAIELAQCDPPLSDMAISHVIHWIPTHDPPTLKYPEKWSLQFIDFITGCLQKKSSDRPNCSELLLHSFLEFSREDAFLQPPPEPDPSQLSVAPPPENDDWTDWTMQGTIATGQFQTTGTWADWSVDMADNGDGPLSPEMVMDINNTARLLTGMPETMGNATKRAKVMQQQAVPGITELVAKHEREMYILQDNLLREFQKKKKELLKIVKLLAEG
uniref:Protein kinase domain-containing protein n=1 Tax=Arcella intermedia TaxID=1963864 RepID=A0A6B2L511_9EUKA